MRPFILVLLSALIGYIVACKCLPVSSKDAFCRADWVSHVRIRLRSTKQPNVHDSNRPGLNHIKYSVEHVKVFKTPSGLGTMPTEIFSPSESAACGVILDTGKEYLLSGRNNNGSLSTVICGQILPDNPSSDSYESVLQWMNVPSELENALTTYKC